MTTAPPTQTDVYTAAFEQLDSSQPVHALRREGFERFQNLGWPTRRNERWKYTNLKSLQKHDFVPAADVSAEVTAEQVQPHSLTETDAHNFVFVNGNFDPGLSHIGDLPSGVRLMSLADAIADDFDAIEPYLDKLDRYNDEMFTALNAAFLRDGAVLFVPKDTRIDKPVHLLFVTASEGQTVMTHPRVLIVAEQGSQATVIERYIGLNDETYLTNAVTEIIANDNAFIDHYQVTRESENAYHISALEVRQEGNGNVTSHNYSLRGKLIRNNIDAVLNAENGDATFNGLFLTEDEQHVDSCLRIDHMKPHCRSWQFYKGVLDDKSTGAFAGRIWVEEDAQKTDAKQTNMNLLLSDDAKVYTRPQLEIFADDVKCTHGATIGQLEPSHMFYLQARGIDKEAARSLLVYAFANETISEVRVPELREQLETILLNRLPQSEQLHGGL